MKLRFIAWLVVLGAPLAAIAHAGCTVFDDVVVPANGGGGRGAAGGHGNQGGSGGAGGRGGAGLGGGYLSTSDAARLCGMAQDCPQLSASLVASFGLPVARATGTSTTAVLSQSECISWLAGPLPPSRTGFDVQQPLLRGMARAADCTKAAALAPVEFFVAAGDPRCTGEACTATDAIRCAAGIGVDSHCDSDLYLESRCLSGKNAAHTPQCGFEYCGVGAQFQCTAGDAAEYCDEKTQIHQHVNCACSGLDCDGTTGVCKNPTSTGPEACGNDVGTRLGVVQCATTGTPDLEICDDSLWIRFDCQALGGHCGEDPSLVARCVFDDAACQPGDGDVDLCATDGVTLHACLDGRKVDVSCPKGTVCQDGHCTTP
ncbi:MAG TPA: hypothetical protein VHB21_28465 [Minicystis sp.]|nr:hypothetical protein [Minicystis sp.]